MCRIFAVRSPEPISVAPAFSRLRELAAEHKDGWGIARFDGPAPVIDRGTISAQHCPTFLSKAGVHTRALLVHIRLASVGTVKPENTHPFTADGWVFMHNGTLKHFAKARSRFEAELAPNFRAQLQGDTDSECCFALFRTYVGKDRSLEGMARALARVFDSAARLCDDETEGARSAMNFLVSDGVRIAATRRDRTLFVGRRGKALFVASEQVMPDVQWEEVPEDALVTIDEHLCLTVGRVEDWLEPL
jgi:glutamine amidotransferase